MEVDGRRAPMKGRARVFHRDGGLARLGRVMASGGRPGAYRRRVMTMRGRMPAIRCRVVTCRRGVALRLYRVVTVRFCRMTAIDRGAGMTPGLGFGLDVVNRSGTAMGGRRPRRRLGMMMDDRQWMRRRRNGGDRKAGRRNQAGDNQFHSSLQR